MEFYFSVCPIVQTLTQTLLRRGLANKLLTNAVLEGMIDGGAQRRYHLVNRALKAGELVRLSRGQYVLSREYRGRPVHSFALAQAFVAGSYVSFETALSHHGWIPEGVEVVASVTPGRKSVSAEHAIFGSFSFHPLATERGYFLEAVERVELEGQVALVAKPVRWRSLGGLLSDGSWVPGFTS